MLTKTWRGILELAQRAPSPHNVQPWKVRIISERSCQVYIEVARTLPKEDTTGSFIISGMVMYLETMRYAAQHFHHDLHYTVRMNEPITNGLQLFADVVMDPSGTIVPEFDLDTIVRRRTSRLPYSSEPVSVTAQQMLRELVGSYGHAYGMTDNTDLIERIMTRNITALFADFNSPSYHDEIVSWFRFTQRSSALHKDGLDYRCMQVPAPEYYVSARFPFILKLPILRSVFAKRYRKLLGTTPCVAWISGAFWKPEDSITAGKLLMRFWLKLTELGLYLHPFGNLITNKPARDSFEALTGTNDVWFVIRIGYTDTPPESYRHPVEQILIGKEG